MYLRKLTLTNMRAFRTAEFDFHGQAGVHLIVGVNGVGKSTALEALRVTLSQLMPQFVATGVRGLSFSKDDITQNEAYLVAQLTGEVLHYPFRYTIDRKAEANVPEAGPVKDGHGPQVIATPDVADFYLDRPCGPEPIEVNEQGARLRIIQQYPRTGISFPLALYYSPHRSLINNETAKVGRTQKPAYVEALNPERTFSVKAFADWWRAFNADERKAKSTLDKLAEVFESVVTKFLPGCHDIQLCPSNDSRHLLITKNGYNLNIGQLSDGERSILTLALELARRLYLANPHLENPLNDGQAIVLIDELDLHLHPGWQREVVQRLESTFPKCQIIASTHSPQIIGEVVPENISLVLSAELAAEINKKAEQAEVLRMNKNQVFSVSQALGMDSNWILTHVMQTPERDKDTAELIKEMFDLLARRDYNKVPAAIEAVESRTNGPISDTNRAKATLERVKIIGR